MIRSMFSGISGLKANQLKLDVIGNNIANVNTTAFKSGRVSFTEVFTQTIKSANPPSPTSGGTNPQQIGLGVAVSAIATNHTAGSIQRTDNPSDLAIEGNGFFVVNNGGMNKFTRNGKFDMDEAGNLVSTTGAKVMGWNIPDGQELDEYAPIEAVNLSGISMSANPTSELKFEGNLNSETEQYVPAAGGNPEENAIQYNIAVFDSLGQSHTLTFKFMKTATANVFNYSIETADSQVTFTQGNSGGILTFGNDGKISAATTPAIGMTFTNGASALNIASADITFEADKFTQYANTSSVVARQDGYPAGELENLSIDRDGRVIGMFSNGRQEHKASIAMASFINPGGLEKVGDSMFSNTWNSGEADIGLAGTGERGIISPGSLEMSNVDLSKEFTEMIVAQRGFQANSRIISTSDELLQELVNLKR